MPAAEPEKLNVPRSASDAAEPLREPSERPAPTPYKRERAQGQWSGTLQMPDVNKPLGSRSEERMIAAKPGVRAESGAVEVHGAAKIGTPEPTMRTATAGIAPSSNRPASNRPSGLPAAPPPSGAPPAIPSLSASAKSPMPPPPKRDDPSVPRLSLGVEKIPSGRPVLKPDVGVSQPMQLSLSASDHVETSLRPEAHGPQRSMLPWIVIAVLLIGGGVVFAMTRGGDEPAPIAQDRVEAVPAVATPTAPTEPPQAATPTAPVAPSVPVPIAKPEAPKAPPVEQAKAAPKEEKIAAPAKPSTKRKARSTKKPAKAAGPVLKVSPEGESDLEAALRAAERMAEPEEEDLAPPEPPSAEPPSPD
jgi:hypothetical protein